MLVNNAKLELPFATPILSCVVTDASVINAELRERILEEQVVSSGIRRSNVGSWHSNTDIFEKPWPSIDGLKAAITEAVGILVKQIGGPSRRPIALSFEGWACVSRAGDYNRLHSHPGWMLSGVYYVSPGVLIDKQPDSGLLEFVDPRPAADWLRLAWLTGSSREVILPREGLLVIFPSWLSHYVNPYAHDEPRIAIAFNATVTTP